MKKGWKLLMLIACSIAGVGLVFCIAAKAMGASTAEANRILGTDRLVTEIGRKVEKMEQEVDDAAADQLERGEMTGDVSMLGSNSTHNFENVEKLKVEVPALEVIVRESERDDIEVRLVDVPQKLLDVMRMTQDGDELEIEIEEDAALKNWLKNNGDYGTMFVELPMNLQLEKASLQIGAGTLEVLNIYAHELDISVGAGEVTVPSFTAHEVEIECGTGSVDLNGTVESKIEIECGIGSVTYYDSGSEEDYNYELSCGIGSLSVGNQSFDGLGGEKKIKNANASKKMQIECGIGEVEVNFAQ